MTDRNKARVLRELAVCLLAPGLTVVFERSDGERAALSPDIIAVLVESLNMVAAWMDDDAPSQGH
jgi:hypothetical protein